MSRKRLPVPQPDKINLNVWAYLKQCVGKELSKVPGSNLTWTCGPTSNSASARSFPRNLTGSQVADFSRNCWELSEVGTRCFSWHVSALCAFHKGLSREELSRHFGPLACHRADSAASCCCAELDSPVSCLSKSLSQLRPVFRRVWLRVVQDTAKFLSKF